MPVVTCAGVMTTQKGPVTLTMNQCAHVGKGHSIHASTQMECHGDIVDDKAITNNGLQQMITVGGYLVPFAICIGLVCVDMHPPTDAKLHKGPAQLPQVMLTSDSKWDLSCIDSEPDCATCFDAVSDLANINHDLPFDDYGEHICDPDIAALCHDTCFCAKLETMELPGPADLVQFAQEGQTTRESPINFKQCQPQLGWLP